MMMMMVFIGFIGFYRFYRCLPRILLSRRTWGFMSDDDDDEGNSRQPLG